MIINGITIHSKTIDFIIKYMKIHSFTINELDNFIFSLLTYINSNEKKKIIAMRVSQQLIKQMLSSSKIICNQNNVYHWIK